MVQNRETLTCPPPRQHAESQTCPFCRREIKGREAVSIYQFQGRPAAEATIENPEDGSDQEDGELEQVSRMGRTRNRAPGPDG